jgi:hypothetical protein
MQRKRAPPIRTERPDVQRQKTQSSIHTFMMSPSSDVREKRASEIIKAPTRLPAIIPRDAKSLLCKIPSPDRLVKICKTAPDLMNIPVIPKKYEEKFMAPPRGIERPCAAGDKCECIELCKIKTFPTEFIGKEFIIPGQQRREEQGLCVFCIRREVSHWFWVNMFNQRESAFVLNPYRVIVGVAGEYSETSVFTLPATRQRGILGHFPMHQRDTYVYRTGVEGPSIAQIGLDFQDPLAT